MRRIYGFFLTFLLIFAACVSVSAISAPAAGTYATVSQDGTCQVNMTVKIHLDQAASDLTFPVPGNATNITLNGNRVRTQSKNDSRLIDLSDTLGNLVGDITITVSYALNNVIHTTDTDLLELQLPLLSGFSYPVESLEFSVTLPGLIDAKPAFSSGYHQANIEKDLTYTVSGATISGASQKELKDHETLVMTLAVSEEMFPQTRVVLPDLQVLNIAMAVCAVLAILYWLIFLRCAPFFRIHCTTPPEGCTAGELGSILTSAGTDLTMMVLTWAQLGYVLMQLDRNDRVTLYKRMDMGNERSDFERRCFKLLFGKRDRVDASGGAYGALSMKVRRMSPNTAPYFRPHSGNPHLFRAFAAAMGLFAGISLGISLSAGAALQWLLVIVLAAVGAYSAWLIHNWASSLYSLNKRPLWTALACCGGWILLGILAGQPGLGFLISFCQLLFGQMATFGGLRTEAGRQASQQILGLRYYLCHVDRQELSRICEADPDYFHSLAPYALTLGADAAFARRFGKVRLPESPYLTTGNKKPMTALEWSSLLRRTVGIMNSGESQHAANKLLTILRNIKP